MSEIEFEVKLLYAEGDYSAETAYELATNCTPVCPRWWIFEGDLESLDADVEVVEAGVVGSLGGKTQEQMIEICRESFMIDVTQPFESVSH